MIIVTSLSPNHSNQDNQQAAIDSWQKFGKCYTMNTDDEDVSSFKGIKIVRTDKTINGIIGKRLININSMIDFAIKMDDDLLMLNSDIILESLPIFYEGITIISRYDYTTSFDDGKVFSAGFDVFFIPKKLLSIFPPSIYAMGVPWWDYWIPYRAILAGVPVYWPFGKHAYHKLHLTQYSQEEWNYIGEYFRWEFKLSKQLIVGQIATNILLKIQSKAIR